MKPLKPAPLLIVIASFDPNNNGKNDYDPAHPELLYDKTSPIYGEQWAMSKPEDFYFNFFGDEGDTLKNYYKEMTGNKFWFYPVPIDHPQNGGMKDGVLIITVPLPHPAALRNFEGYTNETAAEKVIHDIVCACDPYIDFAKYDENGDGKITPDELAIIIMNAGYDRAGTKEDKEFSTVVCENGPIPSHRFMVHGTSQGTNAEMRGNVKIVRVSNVGEYRSVNVGPTSIGTPAHELAHNVSAQDMYSRYTGPSDQVPTWPLPLSFSLMSSGNHLNGGKNPSYIDPYQRIYLGWAEAEVADKDGIYTLYSTLSGKYNIIKVTTPNPKEYFLCELRMKEGFEKYLTAGEEKGGVIIWHIDEKVNEEFFFQAQAVSSRRIDGKRHDLGNALLPKKGFEEINDENGNFVKFGPLYKEPKSPGDPFFYASEDGKSANFNSKLYCGAANQSYSLNEFPEGVSRDWNLNIEVLDIPGSEMRIKITRTE